MARITITIDIPPERYLPHYVEPLHLQTIPGRIENLTPGRSTRGLLDMVMHHACNGYVEINYSECLADRAKKEGDT